MMTRRAFLAVAAVGSLGAVVASAVARASAIPDPAAASVLNRGRMPTQWGMDLPGISRAFVPTGRQLALTFDACDGACDDALLDVLQRKVIPAVLMLKIAVDRP